MSAVKSAERACAILSFMAQKKGGLTNAEISRALHIPTSSLSYLLAVLIQHRYLSLDALSKQYSLGPQILTLTARYLDDLDIVEISRPTVQELTFRTGESAAVAIRDGWSIVNVCKEDSPQLIKRTLQIGARSPMYASACGKAILAYLPDTEVDHYLSSIELTPLTKRTITDARVLQKELKRIRSIGIAYNREELSEDIIAIAAPIFDLHESAGAAVVVSFPISRTSPKKERSIERIVCGASKLISEKLGFKGNLNCHDS